MKLILKKILPTIILVLIFFTNFSNTLKASTINKHSINTKKITLPLRNITPQEDVYLVQFFKNMNNPRIIYKNGQVIFYPDPSLAGITIGMVIIGVLTCLCATSIDLAPITIILLIIEVILVIGLCWQVTVKNSMDPYITLDDYGIKLKNRTTSWSEINNISKEEITKYKNGWKESEKTILHFYGKCLNSLFNLDSKDEYISANFDTLTSLINHYLEKSDSKFTQNFQKTTISENTPYHSVYAYR